MDSRLKEDAMLKATRILLFAVAVSYWPLTVSAQDAQTASSATALDLQEKCARQAQEMFKSNGWDKHPAAVFSDHYNAALNKCFVVIEDFDTSDPAHIVTSEMPFDAFEGTNYGQYMFRSEDKPYWEVKPVVCNVILQGGDKKECRSQEEFEDLLNSYMGPDFH